jgi:hypothetical protein
MGLPVAAALTSAVQTKRARAETKDAVHIKFALWHAICYGPVALSRWPMCPYMLARQGPTSSFSSSVVLQGPREMKSKAT